MSLESSAPVPHDAHTATDFVAQLRRLKAWSGLTYRELEKEAAKHGYVLPHSTIASALKRESLPREELVKGFVRACGCLDETVAAWVAVRRALAVGAHSDSRPTAEPSPLADDTGPSPVAPDAPAEDAARRPGEPAAVPPDDARLTGRPQALSPDDIRPPGEAPAVASDDAARFPEELSAAPAGASRPRPTAHPDAAASEPDADPARRTDGALVRSRPAGRRTGPLARVGVLASSLLVLVISASSRAIPDEPPRPSARTVAPAAPPPPTPVGWWRFEETGGRTALDASGHGMNLRISGDATRTTAPPGHALSLGGNGHAVARGPVIRTDAPFTITAWALLEDPSRSGTVVAVHEEGAAPDVVLLAYDAEHTDWAFMVPDRGSGWANGDDTAFGGRRPAPGRWTHLAAVFDPAERQLCLYVDGERGSCRKRTTITRASGPLDIGRALFKGSLIDGWQGAVDDVRVFGVPLSRRQVRQVAAQRS
ncbi:LamG-like jellyroll fold domain-containing protein [Actinoallomurus sp. CA-150999]|uniref:LamG domain-containing protein n=1 Tax=Actinoallomurus sp. CA-150999 TaxID=3239887 RepID=UPI003D8D46F7